MLRGRLPRSIIQANLCEGEVLIIHQEEISRFLAGELLNGCAIANYVDLKALAKCQFPIDHVVEANTHAV